MNTLRKIFVSITAVALLFLTSCLDDKDVNEFNGVMTPDFAATPYVVDFNEMPNSAGYVIRTFPGTTDPDQFYTAKFRVNLSSPWQLKKDLVVTVKLDDEAATKFAAEHSGFTVLNSSKHTFTSTTVTIPAGEREVEFPVDFYTKGLSADDKYVVAFTITGTDNPDIIISGNFGTQYVKVGVTNLFHGTYDVDALWLYHGSTDYSAYAKNPVDFGTLSSRKILTNYTYAPWGNFIIEVDLDNPQTIDGHDNAYKITVTVEDDEANSVQMDDYDGGVWNYCWQTSDNKWHFKIAEKYYSNISANTYDQQ